LLTLQNVFRDTMEDGETRIVTIVGEAGVGKSRLLYEFEKWIGLLPDKINRFNGWATPGMQATSYDAIRRMFAHRFGIQESDSAATVRDKFRAGMAAALEVDRADLIGQLIGFDLPASQALQRAIQSPLFREQALAGLTDYFRAVAHESTVLFLEDMHWADDSSLDLIDHLAGALPEACLLIVCLARPTLFERRPGWGEGLETHMRLQLKALSRRESRSLLAEILQRAEEIPIELRDLVVEGAEGNPFYVEELIKMLIDDGVIRGGEGRWQVELERLSEVHVPPTLAGVLQARLDSLPVEERELLQRASVVGRLFWDMAVAELATDEEKPFDKDKLVPLLKAVRDRELVFRREHSTFAGTEEYTFKHALLRDATYETVLLKLRRMYHKRVAAWLEASAGERLGEYLGLIATHYELAGDQPEKAIAFLLQAGNRAAKLSASEEAIVYLNRGLDLLPALPDNSERIRQELNLLITLGPPLIATKGYAAPEVERLYSRARDLCGQVEETAQLLSVLSGLCTYYMVRPDYQKGSELGEQFLERSQRAQDPAYQAAALFMLGGGMTWQGELESAREYLERSIDLFDSEKCRHLIFMIGIEPRLFSLTYLAYVLWLLGYPDQGLKRTQEALALAHELDNPFYLAYTFCVSGVHNYFRREEQIVREQAEAAIMLSTKYGFAQWMAQGGLLRGWALVQQGEGGEEHCAQMHQAMDSWRATGADVGRPYYLLLLAETHRKLGQIEEGLGLLTEALTLTENNREYWMIAELYRLKGELLSAQSKGISVAEAEDCFHQAIKFARQQNAKSLELKAVMSLSRLWQKQGKREEALQMLAETYRWFTEGFDTVDLQEAKQLLEDLA
jgi:predicted ATPase